MRIIKIWHEGVDAVLSPLEFLGVLSSWTLINFLFLLKIKIKDKGIEQ